MPQATVPDISRACWARVWSCALTLPVKQRFADCVVFVHSRGRIHAFRFVESYEENISWKFRDVLYAFSHGRLTLGCPHAQASQDFVARVLRVQFKRAFERHDEVGWRRSNRIQLVIKQFA